MSETQEQEAQAGGRRRRWPVFIGGLVLLGVLLAVASRPTVRVRYYLWQLERAFLQLPTSAPTTSPRFSTVMHYQRKLTEQGEAAAEPLLSVRHEHDRLWYWVITTTVGGLRPAAAEDRLVSDTRSQDFVIAHQALRTLGALRQLHCQEQLRRLLSHPSAEVRATTLRLVTDHRVEEVYPLVVDMLQSDPEPMVRALSARAVSRLGGRKVIPLLIKALDDPGVTTASPLMTVRSAVEYWLRVLTGQAFVDKEEWEHWWQDNAPKDTAASAVTTESLASADHPAETSCP